MITYNDILEKFHSGELSGKTYAQIIDCLNLKKEAEKQEISLILDSLVREGCIFRVKNQYCAKSQKDKTKKSESRGKTERAAKDEKDKKSTDGNQKNKGETKILTGVVTCFERGFGFLTVDGYEKDFFIPARKMGAALQGDTVKAKWIDLGGKSDEVEVVDVVRRGITKLCGTFYFDGEVYFVRPDDRGYLCDVIISDCGGAKNGDKVMAEIVKFPKNKNPQGKILEVFGERLTLSAEEAAIIANSKIKEHFEESTLSEAVALSQQVAESQLKGRLDLRNELIFTVDGETARDFDDAVSLKITENGNYLLGVHIADVSEYVREGTSLDREAFERSTSVYLPDRVIPMLPFELSNGICSLNEGVDRLTLSVISEIDQSGEIIKTDFYKSVINSSHRMTYTAVQKIIDGDEEMRKKYADISPVVDNMSKLRNILENKRRECGEIDLSVKEADIFAENGKISISEHKSNDATMLIEQFMIFANEAVARFLTEKHVPCVYRVHDKLSAEKVESFRIFLKYLGINAQISGQTPKEFQKLLDGLSGEKTFDAVNKMMLRSMQKAVYSEENIGHFGLASDCYLHFTSPIRRYPDLCVHRILKGLIEGKKDELIDLYGDFAKKVAQNSSQKEKAAVLCERDVDDLYETVYMQDHVGEEFDGTVSGVTEFGVFVELENTVEGVIRKENLPRKNYVFNEESMRLECGRFSLTLGDKVRIGVLDADIASRKIEFAFIRKN